MVVRRVSVITIFLDIFMWNIIICYLLYVIIWNRLLLFGYLDELDKPR